MTIATIVAAGLLATSAPAAAQTGVTLDGSNDYVTFGTAASLGSTTFTLEGWFMRTAAGATASTGTGGVVAVPLITKGRGEADGSNLDMNWFLGIRGSDNVLVADYEEGTGQTSPGLNHPVAGVTPIGLNTWYHAAATFDGTTWRLYLNGIQEAELIVGAGRLPQNASIQHAGVGTAMTSTGSPSGAFAGTIDEVRVWNVARSQVDIQNDMLSEVLAGGGLVGRWGFNEGAGTNAANSVGGGPAGTLTNGAGWGPGSPFALEYALDFGGTNAYVTFGTDPALGLGTFTVETWFRRDGGGVSVSTGAGGVTAIPLVTKGVAEVDGSNLDMNWFLGIRASDGVLTADFEEGAGGSSPGLNHPIAGVTPILNGTWYHAAVTYDGNEWRLYLNGNLESFLVVGEPPQSASIQHAGLATALNSSGTAAGFFDGALDEVRVWNFARTEPQIQADINNEITAAQAGLVARWGLNEGTGLTAFGSAGTTVNGAITGSNWSWGAGAPFDIVVGPPMPPDPPSNLVVTPVSHAELQLGWMDNSSNETSFEIERSTTGMGGPFSPLASVGADVVAYDDFELAASSEYCYRVRAVNLAGESAWTTVMCEMTPAEGANALDFGGSDAYVALGQAPALGLGVFTIECWFRRDGAGVTSNTGTGGITDAIPLVTKGRGEAESSNVDMNWFLGIRNSDGVLAADFEEGAGGASPGLNHPVFGSTPIVNGVWYHAAVTYDGSEWRLYLNGALENTVVVGQPPRDDSIQHAALGSALNSTGVPQGFFDGLLDEVRVWDVARTETQVRSTINGELASAQPNLVARWGLNEGDHTHAFDSVGSTDGEVAGAAWAWVGGAPFDLDFEDPSATVVSPNGGETWFIGDTEPIVWIASDDVGVTSVDLLLSRSGIGGPYESIASGLPNTGSFDWTVTGPGSFDAYVRVVAHDAAAKSGSDESDLSFIISDPATPTLLSHFTALPVSSGIEVRWAFGPGLTADAVRLERAVSEAGPWSGVSGGTVSDEVGSLFVDAAVEPGQTYWYRLVITDGSDQMVFGPVPATAATSVRAFALAGVTPNPSAGPVRISFALPRAADVRLSVIDVTGREVDRLADGLIGAGVHEVIWNARRASRAPGVYFVRFETPERAFVERFAIIR